MFEVFTNVFPKEDAISILKDDHNKVKDLFEKFENAETLREKKKIAAEAIMELKIHAEIEEKIFYPAVRRQVETDLMNEADEEHHVAKLLIAELDLMDGSEDHWEAKFTVLAENIKHHIKEEEGEMLPQARKTNIDFEELGQNLMEMKQVLKQHGVPASDEEKLFARAGTADSPAKASRAKPSTKVKGRSQGKTGVKKAKPAGKGVRSTKKTGKTSRKPLSKAKSKTASKRAAAASHSKSRSPGRRHA